MLGGKDLRNDYSVSVMDLRNGYLVSVTDLRNGYSVSVTDLRNGYSVSVIRPSTGQNSWLEAVLRLGWGFELTNQNRIRMYVSMIKLSMLKVKKLVNLGTS